MSLENNVIYEASSSVSFLCGEEKKKSATRSYQYMQASWKPSLYESRVSAPCCWHLVCHNGTCKRCSSLHILEDTVSHLGWLSPVPWNLRFNYRYRLQLVLLKTQSLLSVIQDGCEGRSGRRSAPPLPPPSRRAFLSNHCKQRKITEENQRGGISYPRIMLVSKESSCVSLVKWTWIEEKNKCIFPLLPVVPFR